MSHASHDVLDAARRLQGRRQPYALVSVLRAEAPASARPGDKAVVTADGVIDGWVGGGCAQPAVLQTVRRALADGRARLIRITPSDDETEATDWQDGDLVQFGMRCHSGGTLELFVDPMLPPARLTVFGDSPVSGALAGLAPRVGFELTLVAHGAEAERFPDAQQVVPDDDAAEVAARVAPGSFVVVATQGRRDLPALRAALALQARRIWFVASARKAEALRQALREVGEDDAAVQAIVAPAGQAIGAQTPEEIALSVLAAVVAARRGASAAVEGEVDGARVSPSCVALAVSPPAGSAEAATREAEGGAAQALPPRTALPPSARSTPAEAAPKSHRCCGG